MILNLGWFVLSLPLGPGACPGWWWGGSWQCVAIMCVYIHIYIYIYLCVCESELYWCFPCTLWCGVLASTLAWTFHTRAGWARSCDQDSGKTIQYRGRKPWNYTVKLQEPTNPISKSGKPRVTRITTVRPIAGQPPVSLPWRNQMKSIRFWKLWRVKLSNWNLARSR